LLISDLFVTEFEAGQTVSQNSAPITAESEAGTKKFSFG